MKPRMTVESMCTTGARIICRGGIEIETQKRRGDGRGWVGESKTCEVAQRPRLSSSGLPALAQAGVPRTHFSASQDM